MLSSHFWLVNISMSARETPLLLLTCGDIIVLPSLYFSARDSKRGEIRDFQIIISQRADFIEPGTSRTRSKNYTPKPISLNGGCGTKIVATIRCQHASDKFQISMRRKFLVPSPTKILLLLV